MATTKLQLPGGIRSVNGLPDISKYWNLNDTPYTSTAQVLSEILITQRHTGLKVQVLTQEYWWPVTGGVTDGELVVYSVGGGGGGVFTDLTDVPSSYTGASLQGVRVNASETGLEFYTPSSLGWGTNTDPSGTLSTDWIINGPYGIAFGNIGDDPVGYFTLDALTYITITAGEELNLIAGTTASFSINGNLGTTGEGLISDGAGGVIWGTTGISDGDKGDITVSGSGATWTIDNSVVTYAKIQNVTAARLLGRYTGSSGVAQEISIGSGLTLDSGTGVLSSSGVSLVDGSGLTFDTDHYNLGGALTANAVVTGTHLITPSLFITNASVSRFSTATIGFSNTSTYDNVSSGLDTLVRLTSTNTRSGGDQRAFVDVGSSDSGGGMHVGIKSYDALNPLTQYSSIYSYTGYIQAEAKSGSISGSAFSLFYDRFETAYNGGTVFTTKAASTTISKGGLILAEYATGSLPTANLSVNGIVYDTTISKYVVSNGTTWDRLATKILSNGSGLTATANGYDLTGLLTANSYVDGDGAYELYWGNFTDFGVDAAGGVSIGAGGNLSLNGSTNFTLGIGGSTGTVGQVLTAVGDGTATWQTGGGGSGDMLLGTSQTVTALKTFNTATFALNNPTNTFKYNFLGSAIAADRTVTLPLLTGADTFTMDAFATTLTNKTLGTGTVFSVIPTINDGITFTFNPNATVAGINIGAHTAAPSALNNFDVWGDSTALDLYARINGITTALSRQVWEDVSTTTYTFVEADRNKIKRFTHASGCTATVPTGLSNFWQVGLWRDGGTVTIASSGTLEGTGTTMDTVETYALIAHRGSDIHAVGGAVGNGSLMGQAEIDFGSTEEYDTSLFVSDTLITATSKIMVSVSATATTDHTIDDVVSTNIVVFGGNVANGSGFTIYAKATEGTTGKYKVNYTIAY